MNLIDAIDGTIDFTRRPTAGTTQLADDAADAARAPARLAPRSRSTSWSTARPVARRAGRLRPVRLPQRPAACSTRGSGPVPLPAQARAPPRGAAVERRLRRRRGGARPPAGTIRATVLIETLPAAFEMEEILYELRDHSRGAQRRPLGLHLLDHQELPRTRPRVRAARPQRGHDDRAVHARLHRAARADLPPARRLRDRRHGAFIPTRRDPEANERAIEKVARRQEARGRRRLRRHLGRAPRPGPDRAMAEFDAVLGDRPNQIDRQRDDVQVTAAELLDVAHRPARRHRGRRCATTSRRLSSTSRPGCAARRGRRSTT